MRALVLLLTVAACADPVAAVPDARPPEPPHGQGSEATGDLVINEVAPRGDGADWIEILDRGSEAIDLCGVFLTDAVDRLDHYLPLGGVLPPAPCSPRMIAPGERVIVLADDLPIVDGVPIDPGHAPFELGVSDELHLVSTEGVVIDGLLYLYPPGPNVPADVTLARDPDGSGLFFERAPSPGEVNP
jgi:hypothetical protein